MMVVVQRPANVMLGVPCEPLEPAFGFFYSNYGLRSPERMKVTTKELGRQQSNDRSVTAVLTT